MTAHTSSSYTRFLRAYYAFHICQESCPVYAVYAIMFLAKGLSVAEVSGLLAVWAGSTVLFELPSGALADRVHRGRLLALSNLAKASGFACWLLPPSFAIYAAGFILWSVSGSLRSGTHQSLLYDTLARHERTRDYEAIAGRSAFLGRIAQGVAFLIGGPLAVMSYSWALWASIIPLLLGSAYALLFEEVRAPHEMTRAHSLREQIQLAAHAVRDAPPIRRVLVFSMLAIATVGTMEEFNQLYFDWAGVPLLLFGVVGVAFSVSEAFGGLLGERLRGYPSRSTKYILCLVAAAATGAAALWPSRPMLIVFAVPHLLIAAGAILNEADLQRAIATAERATITSIDNLLANLAGMGITLAFGGLAKVSGYSAGFAMFAGVLFCYGLWGLGTANGKDQTKEQHSPQPYE